MALERRLSKEPDDSRLVRSLFSLADGLMVGAVLYFGVSIGLFAFSGFDGFEIWMLVALLFISTLVGPLLGWALLLSERSGADSSEPVFARISTELKETRRWRWVAVVAVPVAATLLGVTILLWGWTFGWLLPESNLLTFGTLGCGFVLRIVLRHSTTREG